MRYLLASLLLFGLLAPLAWGAEKAEPSPEFAALKKEYDEAQAAFYAELNGATFDELRRKAKSHPGPDFARRFMELASSNPDNASAFDALLLALDASEGSPAGADTYGKVIELLPAYVDKPEIECVIDSLAFYPGAEAAKLMRDIIAKNPDEKIQARACRALAEGLKMSARFGAKINAAGEDEREEMELESGKQRIDALAAYAEQAATDAAELTRLFNEKYAAILPPPIAGEPARDFEREDLKCDDPARDFESEDLHGNVVNLNSLRGKVVVLDFWITSSSNCRAMIAHKRELVERLKGQAFELVSISLDEKKTTLTDFLKTEELPWTHWWSGSFGSAMEDLYVHGLPTIFVLDAQGVIRHTELRGEELEPAVQALLKEFSSTTEQKGETEENGATAETAAAQSKQQEAPRADTENKDTKIDRVRRAFAAIEDAGGDCRYRDRETEPGQIEAWLRRYLPRIYFDEVISVYADQSPKITDAVVAHLSALTSLKRLDLSGSQVTDAGLAILSALTSLQHLDLSGARATDASLEYLSTLTSLEWLDLSDTQVTDAGLVRISTLTSLEYLDLSGTQVTDAGLEHLSALTSLQHLDLSGTQVTDAGLEHLSVLTSLKKLVLRYTQVTSDGLEHLSTLTSLEKLDLDLTRVTDAGLVHLSGLRRLKVLLLVATDVTDAGLEHLSTLTSLERLDIHETQVTSEAVTTLSATLPKLTWLCPCCVPFSGNGRQRLRAD